MLELDSLFFMYFVGLASWRWRVVAKGARGSKQTTSLKFHAFAEDRVVFEVSSIESKGGGKEKEGRRAGERGGERVQSEHEDGRAAREAKRELQKCEALELKLCLPGPTESR